MATERRAVRPIPGKLFLVGDPKQSIYQFRRAEVALYEEVKERLRQVGTEVLHLTTSFRSPPSIQSFVNLAFAPPMAAVKDGGQATYIPLGPSRPEIIGRPWSRCRFRSHTGTSVRSSIGASINPFQRSSELTLLGWSKRVAGRSKRTAPRSPFGRVTSRFSSANSAILALTSREPMSARLSRDAFRTFLSAGAPFMIARKSSRCETSSRQSSGRMMS